jgi:hypothetical protein
LEPEKAAVEGYGKSGTVSLPLSSGEALVKATIERAGDVEESGSEESDGKRTGASLASTAPEQHRLLTSVRRALEETDDDHAELPPCQSTTAEPVIVYTNTSTHTVIHTPIPMY